MLIVRVTKHLAGVRCEAPGLRPWRYSLTALHELAWRWEYRKVINRIPASLEDEIKEHIRVWSLVPIESPISIEYTVQAKEVLHVIEAYTADAKERLGTA